MILDAYFARRFTLSFLIVGGVFMSLMMLIDLIDQVRRFEDVDVTFGQLVTLVLLNAPAALDQILPFLVVLATVAMFASLARTSELVVTRATGRSGIRSLLGPVLVALVIGVLSVSTLNPIVAATSNRLQQLSDIYKTGSPAAASLSGEGLWLRQGDRDGQSVIHATGYDGHQSILYNVSIMTFADGGAPIRRIQAESAQLEGEEWVLQQAKVWPLAAGLNPERAAAEHEVLRIPSSLTQDRIRDSLGRTSGISIWQLPETIEELRSAGFSTRRHEVLLQSELAGPLFLLSMVLVGAAFTMRHTRFGGTGTAVLISILLGFGLYFIRDFAQVLGENGHLPVPLAAWAPPAASVLLAIGLLLQAEDG
ncbi:MAG: LPS export ABC transporter permease LptG [Pseudomonadota bacterium]